MPTTYRRDYNIDWPILIINISLCFKGESRWFGGTAAAPPRSYIIQVVHVYIIATAAAAAAAVSSLGESLSFVWHSVKILISLLFVQIELLWKSNNVVQRDKKNYVQYEIVWDENSQILRNVKHFICNFILFFVKIEK